MRFGKPALPLILSILLLLSCMAGLTFPAEAQPVKVEVVQAYWGSDSETLQAKPGDQNIPLTIIIQNLDTTTINYLEAKLNLAGTPFESPLQGSEPSSGATAIPPGGIAALQFTLNISEDAALRDYTIPLKLTLITSNYASGVDVEVNVKVPLKGEVLLKPRLKPEQVNPGFRTLTLTLENTGDAAARDVRVQVSTVTPVTLAEGDGFYLLGEILPSESRQANLKLYVPEALAGQASTLTLTLTYVDGYGYKRGETKAISFSVGRLGSLLAVEISPDTVRPEATTVTFTLKNMGQEPVENVEAALSLPAVLSLLSEDNLWRLSVIPPGGEASFEAQIYASKAAVGSAAQATLTVTYTVSGLTRSETKIIGFQVGEQTVSPTEFRLVEAGWGSLTQKVRVGPGDEAAPLYVAIQNVGSRRAAGITAVVQLSPPFSSPEGGSSVSASLPSLAPGQTGELIFLVDVAPDAEIKTYRLPVQIEYLIVNEVSTPVTYVPAPPVQLTAEVKLYGKPVLDLQVGEYTFHAGEEATVKISLANQGTGDILDLNLLLQLPPSPTGRSQLVLAEEDNFWHFDRLKAGETLTIPVKFRASQDALGPYPITASITYRDEWGQTYMESRSLSVYVEPKAPSSQVVIASYSLQPETVEKGGSFTLNLTVKNVGDSEAQLVTVQLVSPQGFSPRTPSTISLGTLKPGEERQVAYQVQASPRAEEGIVYTFQANVTYVDSLGMVKASQSLIGVPLHGTVKLVAFDVKAEPAYPGGAFNLTFTLLNRGTTTALYTEIAVEEEGPFSQVGNPIYVGDLDPNAPLPVSLKIAVKPATPDGDYQVKVKISYEDEYSQPHSFTLNFPVKVSSKFKPTASPTKPPVKPEMAATSYLYPAIAAAVVIIGVAAFLLRRRRRRGQLTPPAM